MTLAETDGSNFMLWCVENFGTDAGPVIFWLVIVAGCIALLALAGFLSDLSD